MAGPSRVRACRLRDPEALDAFLEGLDDLPLAPGGRVLINPNFVAAAPPPVTTDLELLRRLVAWLEQRYRPASIAVGDMPTDRWNSEKGVMEQGDCRGVLGALGVPSLAELGVEVAYFDEEDWVLRPSPGPLWPRGIPLARRAVEADLLLAVVPLKTHWITGLSGALKGVMGLLPLEGTRYIHSAPSAGGGGLPLGHPAVPLGLRQRRDYCDRIAAVAAARPPDYVLVDGRLALAAEGPGRGPVVEPGWILAGNDPVAVDLACLALLSWVWQKDLPTREGPPIREWYRLHPERLAHNGRIDVLERFPLRRHPLVEAAVQAGLWPRLYVPVYLEARAPGQDQSFLSWVMGAEAVEV
ncbi:MAG TPA: DUF362 domain-containing protein [Candidatus Nitrosotenuis sp.]|jgi:uncharacterized protein (DUF362 family)|nr:DUF362 domain-containing protein [Candidatus Nitrosotenuis sp.]